MTERQAQIMRKLLAATTASDSGTATLVREYAVLEVAESRRNTLLGRLARILKRGVR
jgi:hypothetical protein